MSTPAQRVVKKMGGPTAVAKLLGVDVSNVHRWGYPKSRGGADGRVPGKHQQELLNAARARGIDLSPDDFFDPPPSAESAAA